MSITAIVKPPLAVFAEQLAEKKAEQTEKLVIFAWSGELDKVWPALFLATTSFRTIARSESAGQCLK